MKKVITQLTVGIALFSGMLTFVPQVAAQQLFATAGLERSEISTLRETTQLREADIKPTKTTAYVATDINGKKHDIDAILKSGKSIVIDFSAVWCPPCWALHQSGKLEKLYEKFGPKGSNKIEIFWVSTDPSSTIDNIKGTGGGTKGDWTKVNGKDVPYPIFNDPKMSQVLGIPASTVPTLVLLGTDGRFVDCRREVEFSEGSNFEDFAKLLAIFLTDKDKPAALNFVGQTDLYVGETLEMRLTYATAATAPMTKIEWKAPEGITLTKVKDTEYKLTPRKAGTYEITATVTNKNGSANTSITVTVSDPIAKYPFFCGMDVKDKLDKGWRSIDHDGDGLGFDSYTGKGLMGRLGLSFNDPKAKAGAESSDDCLISFGKFYPTSFNNGNFGGENINANNELRSATLAIPADAKAPTFSCYIASFFRDNKLDEVKVMVAELGGEPVELLAPQKTGAGWKLISASLSAYKGKTVQISVIPVVNGSSAVLVDQLRVTMDGSTDVEAPTLNIKTTLYPNPASDYVTVRTHVGSTIELFATDGALLSTAQAKGEETTIALAQLPAGRYLVRITSLEGEIVLRPLIIK